MTKVQAFYCNIIFLSFSCNCYTARLEDLPWLAKLSRGLKTNILLIISVKDVKEIVVGASHYGPERGINSRNQLLDGPIMNYKQKFILMSNFSILKHIDPSYLTVNYVFSVYTHFSCHHYFLHNCCNELVQSSFR